MAQFAGIPHFVTGEYTPHHSFLPDDEYGRCLDNVVKACTDLIVYRTDGDGDGDGGRASRSGQRRVLIGQRVVQPQPDWWYGCGGRMKAGETIFESAARTMKREMGLALDAAALQPVRGGGRFRVVGSYHYTWQFRQQAPGDHGTADVSTVVAIELTAAEIEALKMNTTEYAAWAWVDPRSVVSDRVGQGKGKGTGDGGGAAPPGSPLAGSGGVMTGRVVPPPGGVTRTSRATSEAVAHGYEGGFKYHPALRRSCADFLRVFRWEALVAESGVLDDAALAAAFRRFLADGDE